MRTHAHPLASVAIVTAALIGLGACSSDAKSTPTTSAGTTVATTAGTTAAPATSDTTAATTAGTTSASTVDSTGDTTGATGASTAGSTSSSALPTPDQLTAKLEPLLLTPAEIGPSFVKDTFSEPKGSTPCGVDVDAKYPVYAIAGTQIVQPEPILAMIEEIRAYRSSTDASAAYKLAVSGFSCGTAEEGLTLGTPTDLSSQLGVTGVGISLATAAYQGAIVIAQDRDAIFVFQFQAAAGADTSGVADPATVATAGIKKIEDALAG